MKALALSGDPKDTAEYQWRLTTPLATLLLALIAAPPLAVDTADVLVENAEAPMQPPPPQEPPMPEQGMAQPVEGEM
jgi:hypothetical protein